MSNSLDIDQERRYVGPDSDNVGPDLDPTCLQRLSTDAGKEKVQPVFLTLFILDNWPRGYETFFMLNSTEHASSTAQIPTNEVACFKFLRCCIHHANKC